MVYRSFEFEPSQDAVWPYIARGDERGQRCARTYLLAAHALRQGLFALVIQARHPRQTLEACAVHGVRAILNHRRSPGSEDGHYSVLAGTESAGVVIHDPERGPGRSVAWPDWLALWQAGDGQSEATGPILVAIARDPVPAVACLACGIAPPAAFVCRCCDREMPLQPAVVLGCPAGDCPGRLWEKIFCPYCDTDLAELPSAGRA